VVGRLELGPPHRTIIPESGSRRANWSSGKLCRMVLEVAQIAVIPGQEAEFVAAYGRAREGLVTTPGCQSVRITRGVESPSQFVLLVEWDSVQAHEENFRATQRFTTWRGEIGPYFANPPHVEHFEDV